MWLLSEIPHQLFHLQLQNHFFFLPGDPLKVSIKACNSSNSSDDIPHGHSSRIHTVDRLCGWLHPCFPAALTSSLPMSPSSGTWSLCWQVPALSSRELFESQRTCAFFIPSSVGIQIFLSNSQSRYAVWTHSKRGNGKGTGDGSWGERCSWPQSFFI